MSKLKITAGADFWDQRYQDHEHLYTNRPNRFIESFFKNVNGKNKKALVPGDGDGRNGLWLAGKGMEVHAFDYSSIAVEKANLLARQMNVSYQSEHCDVASWKAPAVSYYDFVVLVFIHLDEINWKIIGEKILQSLASGGTLVVQVFSKKQLGRSSGGPRSIDLLYDSRSFDQFKDFQEIQIDECEIELSEGPFHSGSAMVINFIGREKI